MQLQNDSHPFKVMRDLHGENVEVDLALVRLIGALWHLGIDTVDCCQDCQTTDFMEARAYVTFPSVAHGEAFLALIDEQCDEFPELYQRVRSWRAPGAWHWTLHRLESLDGGPTRLDWPRVWFPLQDANGIADLLDLAASQ